MIGRTNAFSGGGGGCADTDAMVRVMAPAGSTVTFSRGAVTKTSTGHQNADDASVYDYYFIVPASAFSSSPWTVTATLGADTETQTIIVNAADEYDVLITYATYLIQNGVLQTGYTLTAMNDSGTTAPTVTSESGYLNIKMPSKSGVYFNQIDFTSYSTLYIDSQLMNANALNWFRGGVSTWNAWEDSLSNLYSWMYYTSNGAVHDRYTATLNLTSITSSYKWLKLFAQASSSGINMRFYNIYVK